MANASRGRPAHKPTPENSKIARTLAAVGIRHEEIAEKLDISADTLTKYYRKELHDGRVDANAQIAKSLFDQAKSGNVSASIFWLKTRAGWKETQVNELVGANGEPINVTTSINVVGVDIE